jgi:hypothetical protein
VPHPGHGRASGTGDWTRRASGTESCRPPALRHVSARYERGDCLASASTSPAPYAPAQGPLALPIKLAVVVVSLTTFLPFGLYVRRRLAADLMDLAERDAAMAADRLPTDLEVSGAQATTPVAAGDPMGLAGFAGPETVQARTAEQTALGHRVEAKVSPADAPTAAINMAWAAHRKLEVRRRARCAERDGGRHTLDIRESVARAASARKETDLAGTR